MVSPTSVAAIPVGNSPALSSSHPIPVQNPSSAIVNFTLQHLGLISPSVQVSASSGPTTLPMSPRIEAVSVVPEHAGTQQGRATRYNSPVLGQNQPNGQSLAMMGAQQVRVFNFHLISFFPGVIKSQMSDLLLLFFFGEGKDGGVRRLKACLLSKPGKSVQIMHIIVLL